MIRARAGQSVGAQMISAANGAAFAGTVLCYVTGDAGSQALGSVGSGICTPEGNGLYTYRPSLAETDYASVAFTFSGTGAIPATILIDTLTVGAAATLGGGGTVAPGAGGTTVASAPRYTVRDLCRMTLTDLGVPGAGQDPSPEDLALFLLGLNDWIDLMATEGLTVYTIGRQTWPLTASTASYAIGVGATVNIDRPLNAQSIENIGYRDTATPGIDVMFGRCGSLRDYASIAAKTITSLIPTAWYYSPTFGSSTFGTLIPWPLPTASTLQGVIYAPQAVSQFTSASDLVGMPPGYRYFMRKNLAVDLAGAFRAVATPELKAAAALGKANVKRANEQIAVLELGGVTALFGGESTANLYTGP